MRKSRHTRTLRFLLLLSLLYSGIGVAQEKIYFNKDWFLCQKDDAKFYRILEEADTLLKVTDYYINDGKQAEGFVENSKINREILKIRGVFEQTTIGDWTYFLKNGKVASVHNMLPFHKTHGVDSSYFGLLDSLDTTAAIGVLSFQISYFKRVTDYGFLTENDECHGTWVRKHAKSGRIIKTAHNNREKLDGLKIVYYKSGVVHKEMPYKDDFLHGELKKYNRKGILVKGKEYENGTLIETWLYHKPKKKTP